MTIEESLTDCLTELKQLREENTELKRLLRLAAEDFDCLYRRRRCATGVQCFVGCPYSDGEYYCKGKWKHADEALKLIGGDENDY